MKDLVCKTCGGTRSKGRRDCRSCHLEKQRCRAKKRYEERGRYWYHKVCEACFTEYRVSRKNSRLCSSCLSSSRSKRRTSYNYSKYARGRLVWEHRVLAEKLLNRRLDGKEVVHHLDENGCNNHPSNLVVMTLSDHAKLHRFLDIERIIWEKSQNENSEDCWDTLRALKTTAWFERTGAIVQKLEGLGNQQPSPPQIGGGEGSEAMHGAPKQ